jgi:hypothetical protein
MKQTQLSYPTLVVAFQTTTGKLPATQARIHTLRDGELVLYKRSHSRVWQCRYKLYDNEWHRHQSRHYRFLRLLASRLLQQSRAVPI